MSYEEIVEAALKLTKEDRTCFAYLLADSLDEKHSNINVMSDEELGAEIERRHLEMLADPTAGRTWVEVRERVRRELEHADNPISIMEK